MSPGMVRQTTSGVGRNERSSGSPGRREHRGVVAEDTCFHVH